MINKRKMIVIGYVPGVWQHWKFQILSSALLL